MDWRHHRVLCGHGGAGGRHLARQRHQRRLQLLAGVPRGQGHGSAAQHAAELCARDSQRRGGSHPCGRPRAGRYHAPRGRRQDLRGRAPAGKQRFSGEPIDADRRIQPRAQNARGGPPGWAQPLRGAKPRVCGHQRRQRHSKIRRRRNRYADGVWQDRNADPDAQRREEPAAKGARPRDQAGLRHGGQRGHPVLPSVGLSCARSYRQELHLCAGYDRRVHSGRIASDRDARAGDGRAAHGQGARAGQAALRRRDAGLHHRDLLG